EYDASIEMKPASSIATFIAVVFVLLIGVFPSFFINIVKMMLV
ncbi:MAG: hypothetical protein JG762_477, partial [Deferribacteraceae bacterium]|nr:hypothetical protein [Deferribacteraceae bacterium]